jgi:hypothetical protein
MEVVEVARMRRCNEQKVQWPEGAIDRRCNDEKLQLWCIAMMNTCNDVFFSLSRDFIPRVIILGIKSTVPLSAQFSELL